MIPKIVHWCWLSSDPIPESLTKCMDSWKKNLQDYQFIHWNLERFPKGKSIWVDEAFEHNKYAFAADYIRVYALYNYGGVYLDMDVEVLKSFDDFLDRREFLCRENSTNGYPEVAAFGVEPHCAWVKLWLDSYDNRHFVNSDGSMNLKPLPKVLEDVINNSRFEFKDVDRYDEFCKDDNFIYILPCDYFSPKSYKDGTVYLSDRSYSIHHFAGSWLQESAFVTAEKKLSKFLHIPYLNLVNKVKWNVWYKLFPSKNIYNK